MIARDAVVELRYRLYDAEGNEIESSDEDGPIRYRHGHSEILPGLEEALEGARSGDRLRVDLEPEGAYGAYDPEGIVAIPRSELPADAEYERGDWIAVRIEEDDDEGGREEEEEDELEMRVLEVHPDTVLLDANHPLAGQRVTFEIEIASVEPGVV